MPCPYGRGVVSWAAFCVDTAIIGNSRRADALRYIWCVVAVGGCDRAGRAGKQFSCGVQVHSSSHRYCRQNPRPHRVPLPFHATLESDATSASSIAAAPAVSALREIPRAEIPPFPAANSSVRDSPPAAAPRLLRAGQHNGSEELYEANRAWSTRGTGFILCAFDLPALSLAQTEVCATSDAAEASWAGTACGLRLRGADSEWPATSDPWHSPGARSVRQAACL